MLEGWYEGSIAIYFLIGFILILVLVLTELERFEDAHQEWVYSKSFRSLVLSTSFGLFVIGFIPFLNMAVLIAAVVNMINRVLTKPLVS